MAERLPMTSFSGNSAIYLPSTMPKKARRINYDLSIPCQQEDIWLHMVLFLIQKYDTFVKFIICTVTQHVTLII